MDMLPIKRALFSVTDKTNLVEFATFLASKGVELVSTGGTRKVLLKAGLEVTAVSDITGFPEMLDGRVKTLHPRIHAGILADKDNPSHIETLTEHDIKPFDLVCVNLYNLDDARRKKLSEGIEFIDIGGPCMLRAAAKNFQSMGVAPAAWCYSRLRAHLEEHDMHLTHHIRREMAVATFAATATYDSMAAEYLRKASR